MKHSLSKTQQPIRPLLLAAVLGALVALAALFLSAAPAAASPDAAKASAPSAPVGVAVAPGNAKLIAGWQPNENNAALALTSYTVQYKTSAASDAAATDPSDPATGWVTASDSVADTDAEITGLTNGVAYDVRVRASNSAGDSPWSGTASATPHQDTIWAAILTVGQNSAGDSFGCTSGGVTIPGETMPLCSEALTENQFTFDGVTYEWTSLASDTAWDTDFIFTDFTPGVPVGSSLHSSLQQRELQIGSYAFSLADDSSQAVWGLNLADSTRHLNYVALPAGQRLTWANGQRVPLSLTTSLDKTGNGAKDAAGAATPTPTATPEAAKSPGAPVGPVVAPGNAKLVAGWQPPASDGGAAITVYTVHYKTSAAPDAAATDPSDPATGWVTGSVTDNPDTDAEIAGLTNSVAYDVRVRASNSAGDSPWSGTASATPHQDTIWAAILTVGKNGAGDSFGCYIVEEIMPLCSEALTENQFTFDSVNYEWALINSSSPWDKILTTFLPGAPAGSSLEQGKLQIGSYTFSLDDDSQAEWSGQVLAAVVPPAGYRQSWREGQRVPLSLRAGPPGNTSDGANGNPPLDEAHTAPGAPVGLAVAPGNAKLVAGWEPPASDGGAEITGYTVQYKTSSAPDAAATGPSDPATGWVTASDSVADTDAEITGLTNSVAYDVRVRASNSAGDSPWSGTASATPNEDTIWAAILTVDRVADGIGSGCSRLGGRTPLCSEALTENQFTFDGVTYEWGVVSSTSPWGTIFTTLYPEVPAGSGLEKGKLQIGSYTFSLDDDSQATWSGQTLVHVDPPAGYRQSWHEGQKVPFSLRPGNPSKTPDGADGNNPDRSGNPPLDEAHTAPGVPVGLAVAPGNAKLVAGWEPPASDGGAEITGYTVHYKTSAAPNEAATDPSNPATGWVTGRVSASGNKSGTYIEIAGLTNGVAYDVRVRASNSAGDSPWSGTVSATPNEDIIWAAILTVGKDTDSSVNEFGCQTQRSQSALPGCSQALTDHDFEFESVTFSWRDVISVPAEGFIVLSIGPKVPENSGLRQGELQIGSHKVSLDDTSQVTWPQSDPSKDFDGIAVIHPAAASQTWTEGQRVALNLRPGKPGSATSGNLQGNPTDGGNAPETVEKTTLTITLVSPTREYGASDDLSYTIGGLSDGDEAANVVSGALHREVGEAVGSYAINMSDVSIASDYAAKYELPDSPDTAAYTITAKAVTYTSTTANKEYDGTTAAPSALGGAFADEDIISGDSVTVSGGVYASPDAGKGITVTGLALGGADAGNYTATFQVTGDITQRPITAVSGVTVNTRAADGTTDATFDTSNAEGAGVLPAQLADFRAGGLQVSGSFPSAAAGTYEVSVTYSLQDEGSFKASNYALSGAAGKLQGEITGDNNEPQDSPQKSGASEIPAACRGQDHVTEGLRACGIGYEGTDVVLMLTLASPAPVGGTTVTFATGLTQSASSDDYTLSSNTITIAEDETIGTLTIAITADEEDEGSETIHIYACVSPGCDPLNPADDEKVYNLGISIVNIPGASREGGV